MGLNTGALRIYRLNEIPSSNQLESAPTSPTKPSSRPVSRQSQKPTELLREVEKFSTKPIEQLAIIKEANTIISLSNYHVSLYDLSSYELIETLARTKNASSFAVTSNIVKDPETGIPEIISRLAVAVKRRLLLWSWHDSELVDNVAEVVLSEAIRSVTWTNATQIVCGMNGGYVMVDAVTHQTEDIVSPGAAGAAGQTSRFGAVSSAGMGYMGLGGYIPKPLATKLADGQVLLAKDINTLFVDDTGKPLDKRQVPWLTAPESIGYSYPYIVALEPPIKGSLEVRSPDTLSLLQTIALPGAAQLHFPPPTVSLAHAGKGFHISSDRCVWKMGATDYDSQVDELVQAGQFDEAISLLAMLEDALLKNKVETMREVKMLKAEKLFGQRKFRQSMDLMNEDDVHAPPERVLRLYPSMISGEYSKWKTPEEGPVDAAPTEEKKEEIQPSQDSETSILPSVGGITRYFMGTGTPKKAVDTASLVSKKDADSDHTDSDDANDDKPLQGDALKDAVLELNSYLAGTRARLQRVLDPVTGKLKPQADKTPVEDPAERFLRMGQSKGDVAHEQELRKTFQLVDTTLFRAYMFSRPALAGSLFRIPNFCDPVVVKEKLMEHNRYNELVDFLFGKKLHKEALELLVKFGAAKMPDESAPTLHGPNRTIQYLQNLSPEYITLILDNAGWTLKANPEFAMEIFTGDTENAETLPRDDVVNFLRGQDTALEREYLEHVINELGDTTVEFHNRLVELYISSLQDMKKSDEWDTLMARFVTYLGEFKHIYSLGKAFGLIPKDDPSFYEPQAVVLSNMGQHKQALEIYVFKMKDYAKAEEYCNRVYKSEEANNGKPEAVIEVADDETPSIYHTLLSLYMKPPPQHKPQLAPALDLLSKHGARLPASSALNLIPDDLPVSELAAYFRGRIRSANTLVNESAIVNGLRKAEFLSVAAQLHLGDGLQDGQSGRSRHVVVTDDRHCGVCHKRLAGGMRVGGSVVAVLPDNTAVHYGCLNRTGSRPSSSRLSSMARTS